jgi:Ca2+-binding EF-hand superfamily protein
MVLSPLKKSTLHLKLWVRISCSNNYFSGLENDKEVQSSVKSLNLTRKNKDKGIDFEEFENFMTPILADVTTESELNEAFRVFDTKNNGHVAVSDIQKILNEFDNKFTTAEVKPFSSD